VAKREPAAADDAPLPSTLERSPKKARATYGATLASAERSYPNDEARAHRAAWGAVKHGFEKVGDHWEPKAKKGPSDPRSAKRGANPAGASFGGVDVLGKTKAELTHAARAAGVKVTTKMTKADIAERLERANDRATREAREG